MMKLLRFLTVILSLTAFTLAGQDVKAQCAMCTLNAENSVQNGNTDGNGLNNGILYLLAAPYLAVAAVGYIWYKKYRRKNVSLDIKQEKISLN